MTSAMILTYFGIQGLGEPVRWMLSYGKQEFQDIRMGMEDWPAIQPTTPFGKVPMLEFGGKKYTQSAALCRYLGREYGIAGKTNLDGLQADIIVDTIADFRVPLDSYFYDEDEESKKEKLEPLQKVTVPFYLSRFENIVKDNNGYFVNGQLTWADIFFVAISDYLQQLSGDLDFFKDHPNLAALKQKIVDLPEIKAWVAKRPANIM